MNVENTTEPPHKHKFKEKVISKTHARYRAPLKSKLRYHPIMISKQYGKQKLLHVPGKVKYQTEFRPSIPL